MKYYVTMTDIFMSNWGKAENKINKLVFVCDNYEQAIIVANNAKNRTDQRYIHICSKKPYYNKDRYYIQYIDITSYPCWYEKNYFKNRKK